MEPTPADALRSLAEFLRAYSSPITPHVADPAAAPAIGELAAAGPRAAAAPAEYSLIVEAVREGYLLHYGVPRILRGADTDLALLAGDYLYAAALERLARVGDLEAMHELSDLISLLAHLHGDGDRTEEPNGALDGPLWLATAVAVGAGPSDAHEQAKAAAHLGKPAAGELLLAAAAQGAEGNDMRDRLGGAREAIGFDAGSTDRA
jgi:hypothetical protein